MDENRIIGAGEKLAGKLEGAAGAVFGDSATEAKGRARELKGDVQQQYGETVDALRVFVADQPLTALLAAGVAGIAVGMFLNRH